jgi:hypothetical protein
MVTAAQTTAEEIRTIFETNVFGLVRVNPGTVVITGPTGGLGRAAMLAMASRPAPERPDLLLVGRAGKTLTQVTDDARAAGATVRAIGTASPRCLRSTEDAISRVTVSCPCPARSLPRRRRPG